MKEKISRLKEEQDGVMALEACISLTLFLIVMLTLYSMLRMFTIQSMISHAAQESCQSMAIENYGNSSMLTGTMQQIPKRKSCKPFWTSCRSATFPQNRSAAIS